MDPIDRRTVLRGLPVYVYRPLVAWLFVLWAIGLIVLVVLFASAGSKLSRSAWIRLDCAIGAEAGILLLLGLAIFGAAARSRAELAEGYTTTPFAFPEVDLLDARTGIVLRAAGAPLIDKKTFLDRRKQARLTASPDSTPRTDG